MTSKKIFSWKRKDLESQSFPNFAQPQEYFSFDSKRNLLLDKSGLQTLELPQNSKLLNLDLNDGYESWIERDENVLEFINPIVEWVMRSQDSKEMSQNAKELSSDSKELSGDPKELSQNAKELSSDSKESNRDSKELSQNAKELSGDLKELKSALFNADFVSWRGLLTKLAATPYENRESWKVAIIRLQDVIFLCEFETDSRREQRQNASQREKRMSFWGYRFEKFLIKNETNGSKNGSNFVNTNEQFCSMNRSRLGKFRLLFGAEIDAIDKKTGNYVEFKTTRIFSNFRNEENFHRFKTLKWWLQSFLVGISTIFTGFRDDDGILHSIRDFSVQNLPKMAAEFRNSWDPAVCLNFLNSLLDFIATNVSQNDPNAVYLISWQPGKCEVSFERTNDRLYHFLPETFLGKI